MCLVVKKGTEKQILTKDLTVYKIVVALDNKNVVSAPYQRFEYEVNTLYKTKIKKTKKDTCKFDHLAGVPYLNLLYSHGMTFYNKDKAKIITVLDFYANGFHFATTKERFLTSYLCGNEEILEFTVPAGSEIIYDESGLGVSNQIIYTGRSHVKNN